MAAIGLGQETVQIVGFDDMAGKHTFDSSQMPAADDSVPRKTIFKALLALVALSFITALVTFLVAGHKFQGKNFTGRLEIERGSASGTEAHEGNTSR